MAISRRAFQSVYDLSIVPTSRYICRTCRDRLQFNAKQTRGFSSTTTTSSSRSDSNSVPQTTYVEAQTWHGLEHVGHHGHWKDIPAKPQDKFEPWLLKDSKASPDRTNLLASLYIAVVDCLARKEIKQQGRKQKKSLVRGLSQIAYNAVKVVLSPTGTLSHLEDPTGVLPNFESHAKNKAVELPLSDITELLSKAKFDFNDPITLSVVKQYSRISSVRIPDPVLNTVMRNNKSLLDFVNLLDTASKPKPQKTADILIAKQLKALRWTAKPEVESQTLPDAEATSEVENSKPRRTAPPKLGPNVMVLSRRETPVDKEKEIGRWKVIARELEAKGLPVLGHKNLAPQREGWAQTVNNIN
ncbi:hypothetical protein LTR47_000768 [Exophiala xenobiotica]|nr:hypothetical protein LTR47_000768 [Exophiala xenobiotica]KAK5250132.1 hypothetical protein LTS06_005030 [Exophiala xenobiotica]KAK5355428.1 hypothetical protein LTR61_001100 [Exophiala xenobiotica]KAK5385673.1 hypothetical protein LTR11_002047 [Exophiala xenobiotica]KAK5386394.1 hypothetical protein LTS03_001667 [Exophiala xenobiotica]